MKIFTTYFNDTQLILLISAVLLFVLSFYFHLKSKYKVSLLFLVLSSIAIYSFAAILDPFLNPWDERFHALVGKNLMNHPLMPSLYDNPVVEMPYNTWDKAIIWLHKQPLFLWQIALSFKIFGVSEFSLRLPDILLSGLLVLITYRSADLLFNKRTAFISGVLLSTSLYLIELISGRQELEHNDVSFLVYVSLSIWAFIEYQYSGKKYWIVLIGVFAGFAVLCKWLVGLLVYFGWMFIKLLKKEFRLPHFKDISIAVLISFVVFLPWQILSFVWYPAEAAEAFEYNALHFSIAVEGHGGDYWYHLDRLDPMYGIFTTFLIIPALVISVYKTNRRKLVISLLSMVFVVYIFFTLAATKMPSFTLLSAMMVIIFLSAMLDFIYSFIEKHLNRNIFKYISFIVLIVSIVIIRFDIEYLQEKYTLWKDSNHHTVALIHNKKVFQTLNLSDDYVIFNVTGHHYVDAMFYTGLPAYSFIPDIQQYKSLKDKGKKIAVFRRVETEIPDYLKNDTEVKFIDAEILKNE